MGDGPADLARSTAEGVGGFTHARKCKAHCRASTRPLGTVFTHLLQVPTQLTERPSDFADFRQFSDDRFLRYFADLGI